MEHVMSGESPFLSVVAPMFNEQDGIAEFAARLQVTLDSLSQPYEVVLVDDGSKDDTVNVVRNLQWPEVRLVVLARNVGHQRALEAGISVARGRFIVTLDSDGQHPPELIPRMIDCAERSGVDVVYMTRSDRSDDTRYRKVTALAYYRLMRWLTDVNIADSQADFRLMTRRVAQEISPIRGDHVLRILLPALGLKSTSLQYEADERIAGTSRYGFRRQVRLAADSVIGASSKPLRLMAVTGWVVSLLAFIWLVSVIVTWILQGTVTGWASVMTAVLFLGGISLLGLSLIGAYVARIHDVVRSYPRFVVERIEGD